MQSILLTSPSQNQAGEKANAMKSAEETKNIEGQYGENKASDDFASILDDVSSGKEAKSLSEEEGELLTTEQEELEVESLLLEEGVSNSEIVDEDVDAVVFSMGEEAHEELDSTEEPSDNAEEFFYNNDDIEAPELIEAGDSAETFLVDEGKALNPIIAQIESAQKTDTKVNDSPSKVMIQGANLGDKESNKQEGLKSSVKNSKERFENLLSSDNSEKELSTKDNIASTNNLNALLSTVTPETDKLAISKNADESMLNSLGANNSSVEKPLQQASIANTQSLLQSAKLQQPIELHAKNSSGEIGERIQMMLNQGKQEVTIRLDPAELGSMQIKLHVHQDQLQVAIQTQVGQSRDIIEQHLPRLREQLAQEGINLGEASVEQQSKQDQPESQNSGKISSSKQNSVRGDETFVDEQSEWIAAKIPLSAQGIDYYA